MYNEHCNFAHEQKMSFTKNIIFDYNRRNKRLRVRATLPMRTIFGIIGGNLAILILKIYFNRGVIAWEEKEMHLGTLIYDPIGM